MHQIIDAFYRRVKIHPDLAPIFPEDLTETARKQKQFLTQFLGGPPYIQTNMDIQDLGCAIYLIRLHRPAQKPGFIV